MDNILKQMKDDSMVCNVPYMEIRLPENYFKYRIAENIGTTINTFGLFNIYVYDDYGSESNLKNKYSMVLPTKLNLTPSNIEKVKISSEKDFEIKFEYVLEFTKGQTVIQNVNLMQDSEVAFSFVNFIFEAFLPDIIGYDRIIEVWTLCNKLNNVKINVLNSVLDVIIASASRDPGNIKREFRFLLNEKPTVPMTSRKMIKLRDMPRYASTLTSIVSAYANDGKVSSVIRARDSSAKKMEKKSSIDDKIG